MRLLDRLPDSTNSWHCPWFRAIAALAIVALAATVISSGVSLPIVNAIIAGVLLGLVVGMRQRGIPACSR